MSVGGNFTEPNDLQRKIGGKIFSNLNFTMKTIITLIISLFTMTSYSQNISQTQKETCECQIGKAKDIKSLLKQLNSWDKKELDAYERPNHYPNYNVSGETTGYVEQHKKCLKKLGASISWNVKKTEYTLRNIELK